MTEYRKGDVCSLEVVVQAVLEDRAVVGISGCDDPYTVPQDYLTLIRRAPVDLATCDLSEPVPVRQAYDETRMGVMRYRHGPYAWVDYDGYHPPQFALVADLRPLDAPAPESEVERLREVATDALNSALSGVPGWKDEAKAALKNLASTAPSFNPLRDALPKKELDRVERTMTGKPVCGMREAIAKHHATPSDAPTCPPGHIMIGDRAVPEPMREVPEYGAVYWVARPDLFGMVDVLRWERTKHERWLFDHGLIHSTEAAARAHAEAIIALSAGEGV